MVLRSTRERVYQTLAYEIGGILLATPLYAILFGKDTSQSLALLIAMSVAVLVWSPIHNTLFDWLDWRWNRRVASDRPHGLRFVHAATHEATAFVVTLPVIMLIGGHGFWTAAALDIGFTLLYAAYAYVFHIAYDRLRPVRTQIVEQDDGR
jgi:uncharacterized membrane protein